MHLLSPMDLTICHALQKSQKKYNDLFSSQNFYCNWRKNTHAGDSWKTVSYMYGSFSILEGNKDLC